MSEACLSKYGAQSENLKCESNARTSVAADVRRALGTSEVDAKISENVLSQELIEVKGLLKFSRDNEATIGGSASIEREKITKFNAEIDAANKARAEMSSSMAFSEEEAKRELARAWSDLEDARAGESAALERARDEVLVSNNLRAGARERQAELEAARNISFEYLDEINREKESVA